MHVAVPGTLSLLKGMRACPLLVLVRGKPSLGHLWRIVQKEEKAVEAGNYAMLSCRAFQKHQDCNFSVFKLQI